jgi:hypothetical protein
MTNLKPYHFHSNRTYPFRHLVDRAHAIAEAREARGDRQVGPTQSGTHSKGKAKAAAESSAAVEARQRRVAVRAQGDPLPDDDDGGTGASCEQPTPGVTAVEDVLASGEGRGRTSDGPNRAPAVREAIPFTPLDRTQVVLIPSRHLPHPTPLQNTRHGRSQTHRQPTKPNSTTPTQPNPPRPTTTQHSTTHGKTTQHNKTHGKTTQQHNTTHGKTTQPNTTHGKTTQPRHPLRNPPPPPL